MNKIKNKVGLTNFNIEKISLLAYILKTQIVCGVFLTLVILSIYSCNNQENENIINARNNAYKKATRSSLNCNYNIWSHVYNPDRLKILDSCVMVSGVIIESSPDGDGDQHMLLKLDPGQQNLLSSPNSKLNRDVIIIEAICVNNISKNKVGNACDGYVNNVDLPKLKDHVQVTGSYVIDSHNGWGEIHPISKIDLIKN